MEWHYFDESFLFVRERELTLHIEENKIEQFVLEPDVFNDTEKSEILAHINNCSSCKEIYDTYNNIYADLAAGINRPGTSNDEEIARRIYQRLSNSEERKLLSEKAATVQVYDGKTAIVERPKLFSLSNIYYFIKTYPAPAFGLLAITALALAFIIGQAKRTFKDENPVFCKMENYILTAYNNSGEILWKKDVYGIPNERIDSLINWMYGDKRYINLLDIDGNGKNEVLISGRRGLNGIFKPDSLYCFNSDGSIRWIIGVENQKFNYAPNWKRTKWIIRDFFTAKTKHGNKLFLVANDDTYGTALVSSVNPKTGEITSTIYHSGWFSSQIHFDIDGDGEDEIVLGGTSSYQKPFIMILKTNNKLIGVMPDFYNTQKRYIKGNAEYYVLFRVSNLGKAVSVSGSYDIQELKRYTANGIMVSTQEVVSDNSNYKGLSLQYVLNNQMVVQYITPHVSFIKLYPELLKKHVVKEPLDSNYWKAMKDSVLYWDGDRFVNYPTKNKYWDK